jgi:RNA polymerase sigma-70 factor (sigma-E family)
VDPHDEQRFEEFVQEHGPHLLRTAYLLVGDRGHAEDILQTALERAARRWDRIDGDHVAYVRRTIVNLTTDRWRRRRTAVVELPTARALDVSDHHDATAQVDLREVLIRVVNQLPPRQRAVIVLRYFGDLSEADISAALGISVGTVKTAASRARAALREALIHLEEVHR